MTVMNPARFGEAKAYVLRMVLAALAHNDPAFAATAQEVFALDPEGVITVIGNLAALSSALVALLAKSTGQDPEDIIVRMIQEDQ